MCLVLGMCGINGIKCIQKGIGKKIEMRESNYGLRGKRIPLKLILFVRYRINKMFLINLQDLSCKSIIHAGREIASFRSFSQRNSFNQDSESSRSQSTHSFLSNLPNHLTSEKFERKASEEYVIFQKLHYKVPTIAKV